MLEKEKDLAKKEKDFSIEKSKIENDIKELLS